jgi:diguanylate cyclase (GGDEF)-like protein/PAS domain S-box-containing protein
MKAFALGLLLAAFFWLVETLVHGTIFHGGSFIANLIPDDLNELWMRAFTCVLLIVIVLLAKIYAYKKHKLGHQKELAFHALTVMREGCLVADKNNNILYVNPRYEEITGYSLAEVKGKDPSVSSSGKQDKAFYQAMWSALDKEGVWEGEVWNRRKSGEVYPEWINISLIRDKKGNPVYYVGVLSDITSRKAAEEVMNHYAYYDPLTELPNRRFYIESLTQAIKLAKRQQQCLAVLFIDLDHFKPINDKYGHAVGDEFLCTIAKRLRAQLREGDTLSRFGGDEFVILLPDVQSADTVEQLASSILTELRAAKVTVNGYEFSVSMSIGVAVYPENGEDAESLIEQADAAMYRVKNTTRNAVSR